MNERTLTDAQISAGLRAHLPSQAAAGLHGRISAELLATPQVRRRPWAVGLGDADPLVHRRALLLVALLGLAAAISVASVVGAWLRSQDQTEDLSRSTEVDEFVFASYEGLAELPALRLVLSERDDPLDSVWSYDGSGALRSEYNGLATVYSRDITAQQRQIGNAPVWVLMEEFNGHPIRMLAGAIGFDTPNCQTGWRSIETVDLIGRPTRHVLCTSESGRGFDRDLWIDIETGLLLRSRPGGNWAPYDVMELEFGSQAADLFRLEGATMSPDEFACATEDVCASPGPSVSEPPAAAVVSPPPAPGPGLAPSDLDAFVADVYAAYERREPLDIAYERPEPWYDRPVHWQRDGLGNYRAGIWLMTGGQVYESYETEPENNHGRAWRAWGQSIHRGPTAPPVLGLPAGCGIGWTYLGDDLVLDRPAAHIACGFQEFWIDREWLLVTRAHDHDPLLGNDPRVGLRQVTSVTFAPQPAELFAQPADGTVLRRP